MFLEVSPLNDKTDPEEHKERSPSGIKSRQVQVCLGFTHGLRPQSVVGAIDRRSRPTARSRCYGGRQEEPRKTLREGLEGNVQSFSGKRLANSAEKDTRR